MAVGVKVGKIGTFDFNPRGNLWFNDESTLGHKLLSKMGWSKGKGLGKNEDGIKENIKISKKDSLTGIGFKSDIPIAEGCLEYENILSQLQQNFKSKQSKNSENDLTNLESLEQRSQNSRNRLHYQKYVRGKDLYRYSEKDMKCIFLEKPQESVSEKIKEQKELPSFKSQLSVQDYFAMKIQKKTSKNTDLNVELKNGLHEQTHQSDPVVNKKRKNSFKDPEKIKKIKHEEDIGELPENSILPSTHKILEAQNSNGISSDNDNKKLIKKKKKSKKNKLKFLKSCLVNSSSYNLEKNKKVSFNEQVSYKVLDTSLELCTPINDSTVEENMILNSTVEDNLPSTEIMSSYGEENDDSVQCLSKNNLESSEGSSLEIEIENNDGAVTKIVEEESVKEESKELENPLPKCFDLPKNSSSNYNFWLENQRQALKMKLYKNMIKKIKKHKVLGTSNLLDIKGYGNWGF